jgi:hypothetical protein
MLDKINSYDIYGNILPGTLLIGILWLPFALATGKLPSSDISSSVILLVVALVAGSLLQSFGQGVLPSTVRDSQNRVRQRSSAILDTDNHVFSTDFKIHLGGQIRAAFGIQVIGDENSAIANRTPAFFQARTYLQQNNLDESVAEFERLYGMMRGFTCAFFVGCAYLLGWGLSFHSSVKGMDAAVSVALVASIAAALLATGFTIYFEAQPPPANMAQYFQIVAKKKAGNLSASVFLLIFVAGLGYFLGTWKPAPAKIEFFLWAALPLALIAGIRCLHAYAAYAESFAEGVWRDFSAFYKPDPPTPSHGAHAGTDADAPGGHGGHQRGHS